MKYEHKAFIRIMVLKTCCTLSIIIAVLTIAGKFRT